jgi:hypothetical protein
MTPLYEALNLYGKTLQTIVDKVAMSMLMRRHEDSGMLAKDFERGLEFLKSSGIIRYSEEEFLYRITVTNQYRLERLISELKWLELHNEGQRLEDWVQVENMAYYERSTGNVLINGTRKTLKGTNKKLFDALFIANPDLVSRTVLLRIVRSKKGEQSSKIALNEAFSNLRKVCGVTAKIISLSQDGGKLNARCSQLVDEDEIYLPKISSD